MCKFTVSDQKVEANRQNASRSTGPRTAAGKARSSQNAMKHGLFCRDIVVRGEDPAEFEGFKREMLRSLNPKTFIELRLVEEIISDEWRLIRARKSEKDLFEYAAIDPVRQHQAELAKVRAAVQMLEPRVATNPVHYEVDFLRGHRQKLAELEAKTVSEEPPTMVLVRLFMDQEKELELLNGYEDRFRNKVYRALKELQKLQAGNYDEPSELTEYLLGETDETEGEDSVDEPEQADAPILKNEPTAAISEGGEEAYDRDDEPGETANDPSRPVEPSTEPPPPSLHRPAA